MSLGHGALAEFAIGSVRGGGVQNVGSPFISGVSFSANVTDLESVTGAATFAVTTAGAPSFTIFTHVPVLLLFINFYLLLTYFSKLF